jgi:hypothetical protein
MISVLFEAGAVISFTKFFAALPGEVPVLCNCRLPLTLGAQTGAKYGMDKP